RLALRGRAAWPHRWARPQRSRPSTRLIGRHAARSAAAQAGATVTWPSAARSRWLRIWGWRVAAHNHSRDGLAGGGCDGAVGSACEVRVGWGGGAVVL